MAERLGDHDIEAALEGLSDWRREGDELVRDLELGTFAEAIAFVNAVAGAAEAADHHPDVLIHGYNKVRLRLSTHSAGGLTQADVALAATIDGLPGG